MSKLDNCDSQSKTEEAKEKVRYYIIFFSYEKFAESFSLVYFIPFYFIVIAFPPAPLLICLSFNKTLFRLPCRNQNDGR